MLDSTTDSRDAFCAGGKSEDAVIRNIEVRGQAVKSLCADTRAHDDSIPWRQIAGMRDKLIHERSGVDLALVRDVVDRELPALCPKLSALPQTVSVQHRNERAAPSPTRSRTAWRRKDESTRAVRVELRVPAAHRLPAPRTRVHAVHARAPVAQQHEVDQDTRPDRLRSQAREARGLGEKNMLVPARDAVSYDHAIVAAAAGAEVFEQAHAR